MVTIQTKPNTSEGLHLSDFYVLSTIVNDSMWLSRRVLNPGPPDYKKSHVPLDYYPSQYV